MTRAILGFLFFIVFAIACFAFLDGCSHRNDEMAEIGEMVLKKHEGLRIDFTPEKVEEK